MRVYGVQNPLTAALSAAPWGIGMSVSILVIDDKADVAELFRQRASATRPAIA